MFWVPSVTLYKDKQFKKNKAKLPRVFLASVLDDAMNEGVISRAEWARLLTTSCRHAVQRLALRDKFHCIPFDRSTSSCNGHRIGRHLCGLERLVVHLIVKRSPRVRFYVVVKLDTQIGGVREPVGGGSWQIGDEKTAQIIGIGRIHVAISIQSKDDTTEDPPVGVVRTKDIVDPQLALAIAGITKSVVVIYAIIDKLAGRGVYIVPLALPLTWPHWTSRGTGDENDANQSNDNHTD